MIKLHVMMGPVRHNHVAQRADAIGCKHLPNMKAETYPGAFVHLDYEVRRTDCLVIGFKQEQELRQ
ncbi:hypothetical protein [Paenibacillus marinisediminis]